MVNGCSIINGARYFSLGGSQIYFLFHPVFNYFEMVRTDIVVVWKSKDLLNESIKPPATPDYSINQNWIIMLTLNFELNWMEVV